MTGAPMISLKKPDGSRASAAPFGGCAGALILTFEDVLGLVGSDGDAGRVNRIAPSEKRDFAFWTWSVHY